MSMLLVVYLVGGAMLVGFVAGFVWTFHCMCLKLEDAGYLYYRNSSGNGGGGVLYELDRLTRPSIEHVIEMHDPVKHEQEIDGD